MHLSAFPGQCTSLSLSFLLWLLTCLPAQAQVDVQDLINSGVGNTRLLLRAYGSPLTKGFETGLNASWLSSGDTFRPGRFEVRISATGAFAPEKDQAFDITQIGLDASIQPTNPGQTLAPTFFGEDTEGLPLEVYATRPDTGERVKTASFNSAPGIGFQIAPLPMVQVNIGLVQKTELMVRFLPELSQSDNKVHLWGLGLKHQVSQWIPGLRDLPFVVTASAAYTFFEASDGLKRKPEAGVSNPNPGDYTTQRIGFSTEAYQASLVLSKTFGKAFNTYAGLSYSKGQTETTLAGTYPITVIRQQAPYNKEIANLTDPVRLDFDHGQLGLSGGLRLKAGLMSLHLAGTWSQYSSLSAGIGLGWN